MHEKVDMTLYFKTPIQDIMSSCDLSEGDRKCFCITSSITLTVKKGWRLSEKTIQGLEDGYKKFTTNNLLKDGDLVAILDSTNGVFYNFSDYVQFCDASIGKTLWTEMDKWMKNQNFVKAYENIVMSDTTNGDSKFVKSLVKWFISCTESQ